MGCKDLEREAFFEKYKVKKYFEISGLKWETLKAIYNDYENDEDFFTQCATDLQSYIIKNLTHQVHSVHCRIKDGEHLIEKIIRKCGKEQLAKYSGIDRTNYREIVRDLIGVRILLFSKEEWEGVFDDLIRLFPSKEYGSNYMKEEPVAYTRYGDRDIFQDKIHAEYTNKGYRSQHYIVRYKECYCEIQVRTLPEEVYGEFDHHVKYPYREDNRFLIRYSTVLGQLLDSVDEIISTCYQMGENGWDACNHYYEKDTYVDWTRLEQRPEMSLENTGRVKYVSDGQNVSIKDRANRIIFRKDQIHD